MFVQDTESGVKFWPFRENGRLLHNL